MSEYKSMKLDSILTPEQLDGVLDIIEVYRDDGASRILALKNYLIKFRDHLERKGVLPEYLAYAIEYQVHSIARQNVEHLERN